MSSSTWLATSWRSEPERKKATVVVHEVDAFIEYVARHADADQTEVFVDSVGGTVTAVLDSDGDHAGWRQHTAVLRLQQSPAWKAWLGVNEKMLGQADMAEHFEARSIDIVTPDAATMLEIAQDFQATRTVTYQSSRRLSTGEVGLTYLEADDAKSGRKGDLHTPSRITIAIPLWVGGEIITMTARLRYRIDGGTLRLGVLLDQPEDIVAAAFESVASEIRDGLDNLPVFAGQAPSPR